MIRLESWSITGDIMMYMLYGVRIVNLSGNAHGHPRFENGQHIVTSPIMELDIVNRKAKTRSGSDYVLGEPDPEWVEWLRVNHQDKTLEELNKFENKMLN